MFLSVLLSYLPYALVTALTPGPNNIIALCAVSQNGWRGGKQTLLGIATGFFAVMLLCAVFCYELARFIPSVSGILKYVGAAYIAWLAFCVARSGPDEKEGRQISFWKAVLLQFANVKIILFSITANTGYVLPVSGALPALALHAVCFTVIGMTGVLTWAVAGGVLQKFLSKYRRPFNLAMAAVLLYCAVRMLW